MLKIISTLLLAVCLVSPLQAQKTKRNRKNPTQNSLKAFPKYNFKHDLNSLNAEVGVIASYPFFGNTVDNNLGIPSKDFKVPVKLGPYASIGYERILDKRFITSWEIGLEGGYATLREDYLNRKHVFNFGFVGVNTGLNRIDNINERFFILTHLGLNIQYFAHKESLAPADYPNFDNNKIDFYGDLHFKLGFGIKILEKFYVVPTLQLPLLNYLDYKDVNPSLNIYNSRFYLVRYGCKFWFLFNKNRNKCIKVESDPFG